MDQLLSQLDSKINELLHSNAKREDAQKAIEPIIQKIGTLAKDPSIAPKWEISRKEKGSSLKNKGNDELNKNNEKAALYFTLAILLEPENHTYYSNRSACYAGLTLFNEALQDAETTIKLNPNWSRGYGRKGLALFFLKRYDESLSAYKKGLEVEPGNASLKQGYDQVKAKVDAMDSNVLGEEMLAKGKLQEAAQLFEKAITLDPQSHAYLSNRAGISYFHHNNYAEAFSRLGKLEDAIKDMDKAISLRPDWSKGYERKADYLYRLNRFDEAAQCYTVASQLDPTNQNIKTAIANTIQESVRYRIRYVCEKRNFFRQNMQQPAK